ncbi:MAG: hypothetical protein HFF62_05595 [Oscillospiraceae bacterium]|nr:hypothetical protein [Oscillospiraceae bacterium]
MKKAMKKPVIFIAVLAVILAGILYHSSAVKGEAFLHKQDFTGYKMYIHNVFCNNPDGLKEVTEMDIWDEIVTLCLSAEPFRPSTSADHMPVTSANPYFILEDASCKYTFSHFDTQRQLEVGFIHRDKPLICIRKETGNPSGGYDTEWSWLCILPPSDYASLYNLLQPYVDGEMVG